MTCAVVPHKLSYNTCTKFYEIEGKLQRQHAVYLLHKSTTLIRKIICI